MRGLNGMPQILQDYCLRMLWLFADGLRAAQAEAASECETVPETVKSKVRTAKKLRRWRPEMPERRKNQYIDIHCHILPEVDDGARNLEESPAMLRQESKTGRCSSYPDSASETEQTQHYRCFRTGTDTEAAAGCERKRNRHQTLQRW